MMGNQSMNKFEQYLVELLQGNITYDNNNIEVRKQFSNEPSLPIITLDISPGITTQYMYRGFDTKERLKYYRHANININIWCNTEDERESINNQILELYYKERNNHYMFCTQNTNNICGYDNNTCHTINNNTNYQAVKYRCPDAETYGYESLATKYGLVHDTVLFELPFDMDETDKHPPLLRSIIRASSDYVETVSSMGKPMGDITYDNIQVNLDGE